MVLTTVSHSRAVTLSLAFVTCLFPVLRPQAQFPATCSLFRGYLAKAFSVTRNDNIRSHCLIRISDVFEKCGKCRLDLWVWLPVCDFLQGHQAFLLQEASASSLLHRDNVAKAECIPRLCLCLSPKGSSILLPAL